MDSFMNQIFHIINQFEGFFTSNIIVFLLLNFLFIIITNHYLQHIMIYFKLFSEEGWGVAFVIVVDRRGSTSLSVVETLSTVADDTATVSSNRLVTALFALVLSCFSR